MWVTAGSFPGEERASCWLKMRGEKEGGSVLEKVSEHCSTCSFLVFNRNETKVEFGEILNVNWQAQPV